MQDLVRKTAQLGIRIFDKKDVEGFYEELSISKKYIPRMLSLMAQKGSIVALGKGLYTLPVELLAGGPIHSFEIAMKLVKNGAISHRSAMSYHHLTDQMISTVYVTVPRENGANLSTKRIYNLNGDQYQLMRISKENYWGIKKVFLNESSIFITDIEKTLLDGLKNPEYCGGIREVSFAFEQAISQSSPDTLYNYVLKMPLVVGKRLGWMLEKMDRYPELQHLMASIPMNYYQKLDPLGNREGKHHPRWMLIENI